MRTTVIGGGNIGTVLAALLSERGEEVRLLSSRPTEVSEEPVLTDEEGTILHRGHRVKSYDDPEAACAGADLVFSTVPAFRNEKLLEGIRGILDPETVFCFVPGSGGGELVFREELERGVYLCGMERVPTIARSEVYGTRARIGTIREKLFVAAADPLRTMRCCDRIEEALGILTLPLPNYLNLTLTPSNPILHTSRLFCIFREYREGMVYPSLPLFYEDWDLESARTLLRMDEELQNVVKSLPELSLGGVVSLKRHYESRNETELQAKLSQIRSFRGIQTPALQKEGGFVPDFSSRYFASDFPYGLKVLLETAALTGTDCPVMKQVYEWYKGAASPEKEFSFAEYGIRDRNDLVRFYGNNTVIH